MKNGFVKISVALFLASTIKVSYSDIMVPKIYSIEDKAPEGFHLKRAGTMPIRRVFCYLSNRLTRLRSQQ